MRGGPFSEKSILLEDKMCLLCEEGSIRKNQKRTYIGKMRVLFWEEGPARKSQLLRKSLPSMRGRLMREGFD